MVLANLIKTQVDFSLYPSKLFSKHIFDKQPDINTTIGRTQNHYVSFILFYFKTL